MRRIGSITILLAILAVPAQAQRRGLMRGPGGPDEFGNRERSRDLPADAILRLRERLSLTEDQVGRIKEAQATDREARDAFRLETRGLRDQLRDEEITREQFREQLEGRRSSVANGMITYRETLEGILSDEQRSQMRNLRHEENRERGVRGGRPAQGRFRDRGRAFRGPRARPGWGNMPRRRGGLGVGPRMRR